MRSAHEERANSDASARVLDLQYRLVAASITSGFINIYTVLPSHICVTKMASKWCVHST